jgi:ABC-type molybdenum transport system ATPase subunit/photorepair protein PhrA
VRGSKLLILDEATSAIGLCFLLRLTKLLDEHRAWQTTKQTPLFSHHCGTSWEEM